jgi:hypothetical protein
LVPVAMAKNDLWSATITLHQPLASEWLGRVNIFGETDPLAAVTALVLQLIGNCFSWLLIYWALRG